MLVKDIMTKAVVTIGPLENVVAACEQYKKHGVGCLIVKQENLVVGILTERDIIERIILDARDPKTTLVEDIMSRNIKTIHASASVELATKMMKENHIKKLPVVLNNEIVGIVTATDITNRVPQLAQELRPPFDQNIPYRFVSEPHEKT